MKIMDLEDCSLQGRVQVESQSDSTAVLHESCNFQASEDGSLERTMLDGIIEDSCASLDTVS